LLGITLSQHLFKEQAADEYTQATKQIQENNMRIYASEEKVKDLSHVFRDIPHKKSISQTNNTFKRNFTILFKGIRTSTAQSQL